MADSDGILERERRQMEQIMELDMEELQVEEVDDDLASSSSDDDASAFLRDNHGQGGADSFGRFTYDTSLASLHTYLGEVDDTRGRLAFLDVGAIFNLPMFYLEGVVLFPEATLPLRVTQSRLVAAIEIALKQVDAPCTIGVVRIYRRPDHGNYAISSVGTTAEIRQIGHLGDRTSNVITRGQQRFRLRRRWVDVDGVPWGEVQIIQEDAPLRTPRDAFGQMASINNSQKSSSSPVASLVVSPVKQHGHTDSEQDCDSLSPTSIASDRSAMDTRAYHSSSSDSPMKYGILDESSNEDEDLLHEPFWRQRQHNVKLFGASGQSNKHANIGEEDDRCLASANASSSERKKDSEQQRQYWAANKSKQAFQAPLSFWPRWAYEMYDSYALARRAADLWKHIIVNPSMDDFVRKPGLLSFYVGSKLPVSEFVRQELLEIDGISYRLRREIQLLKAFNLIRCRNCQALIAKRSDMVVMSRDGPLNAYVNPHGYVHETITVHNATGLVLYGRPSKEHSWFPGYAWTIASCAACESNIGWLFTATKKNLLPKSFWGIRSSQIADDTQAEHN